MDACIRVQRDEVKLADIDAAGIIATPANSRYNEKLIEAARRSILNEGRLEYV